MKECTVHGKHRKPRQFKDILEGNLYNFNSLKMKATLIPFSETSPDKAVFTKVFLKKQVCMCIKGL